MPPSFNVAFSYMASESPHNAAPSTWARMLSGCTWVPTSVATVSFVTLTSPDDDTATWATHAVQLAVARSCDETQATPMPSPLGNCLVPYPDMPMAASKVLRRRCAPPALAPLPSSMSIRYCAGSLPTAWASSSTMLSTAQKVQPGATDRNCPDGVALCAISLRMARTL